MNRNDGAFAKLKARMMTDAERKKMEEEDASGNFVTDAIPEGAFLHDARTKEEYLALARKRESRD